MRATQISLLTQIIGGRFDASKSIYVTSSLGCCPFYGGGSVVVDYCFMYLTLFVGVLCWCLFWYA